MPKLGLTLIFFFAGLLSLLGQGRDEPSLSLHMKGATVGEVLDEIARQGGVGFSYHSKVLDEEALISFSVEKVSLEECLALLCQRLSISYTLIGKQGILTPAKVEEKMLSLSGFLSDASSGESLIGAALAVKGTSKGVYSNEFGYYVLSLLPGNYTLQCFNYGYKLKEFTLQIDSDKRKNIELQPLSYELPTVEIAPSLDQDLENRHLGEQELSPEQLTNLPEIAGEPGIVNALQSLPGINAHSDASAYFYARGGERDQNIIFIDDAPVYNPSHLFGFYSIFIPDFAQSISVYNSNVPASMGDRLSSVISIRTRNGNLKKWAVSGSLNPFVGRLSLEAPLVKDKSSLFLSYRRSNFEWLYRGVAPDLNLGFSDLQLKWNYRINDKNRIYLTLIGGSDNLGVGDADSAASVGITWANTAFTLRWNHIFGPRLFSNTTLYSGTFSNRLFLNPNYWKSELSMLSFKTDFTHYASSDFTSRFGLDLQTYFINPGEASLDSSIAIVPSIKPDYSRKTVLYYQGEWNLNKKWRLDGGLRFIYWANRGPATYYEFDENYQVSDTVDVALGIFAQYVHLDPRLSLSFRPGPQSSLRLSLGRYHQYLQMISNSVSPFTTLELWLPASPNIKPQASSQASLSYVHSLKDHKAEFSAAAYYKYMQNQIDFRGNAITYLNPLIEGELRFGQTRAYGVEFLVKKDFGPIDAWMSYTYSRAIRRTEGLNGGRAYPAFQDRPHDFSFFIHYQRSPKLELSAYWTSYSGSPFSSPTGFFNFNNQVIPIYDEKNNDRLPAYHRVDFSARWELNTPKKYKRFRHSLSLSVNNVFSHKNVFAVKFNKIQGAADRPLIKANVLSEKQIRSSQVYLIRFFPSLTYRFSL